MLATLDLEGVKFLKNLFSFDFSNSKGEITK